ncbi:MAG: hypothetical protein AAF228_10630 [Pseudomonadota bacterium]
MAIGTVSSVTNSVRQINQSPDAVAVRIQNTSVPEANESSPNNTPANNIAGDRGTSALLRSNSENRRTTQTGSNADNTISGASGVVQNASSGAQENLLRTLLDAQEQNTRFEDFADVPEQLGALFNRDDVFNLEDPNAQALLEAFSQALQTGSEEDISALQELFDEVPEDQIEKFLESVSDFDVQTEFEEAQENLAQTNATEANNTQFSNTEFEQLQQQIQTFQNLDTPDQEIELAVV